ncbi:MAG: UvrD-helicase domain-containing protein [Alphaproteobacteria bacterium]|nr:MAG: UvrD-helicase domain-containing protein [Alphaproteobacteria bacterium]
MYDLNAQQKKAVECKNDLLIVAGAGTGKTKTIVSKISYYIEQGLLLPHQVLATTFTNKAAQEMKHRIESNIGPHASLIAIGTFHKLCLKIVQDNEELLNMSKVQVLPYEDQLALLKSIVRHMQYKSLKPSHLLEVLQRAKEKDVFDNLTVDELNILDIYQNRLKSMNALDFADLLSKTILLWENYPSVLDRYREQYKLICVDEYQDINEAQHRWIKLLSCETNQLCCVGDPDQAIYSFRGSDIKYILQFNEEFVGSEKIVLEQNYRSTDKIISSSNSLIRYNRKRIEKNLLPSVFSDRYVDVFVGMNAKEEYKGICDIIAKDRLINPQSTIAILFRTASQINEIEESLISANIKYSIVGSIQLLDRAEVKDIISYVKFLANPADIISFSRLLQAPKRGIGEATMEKISLADGSTVKEKIINVKDKISSASYEKLLNLIGQLELWAESKDAFPLLMEKVVNESGLFESLDTNRKENIMRWLDSIGEFKDKDEYINYLLWSNIKSDDDNNVQLMTVHAAKGLEFDIVFLPGWEEGVFPHILARANIEEERRLAYVALTRAKSYAVVSYVQSRMQYGKYGSVIPSRFIKELGSQSVQFKSFRSKSMTGKKVFHDLFGYGIVEETGMRHAQVLFGNEKKIVELSSISECK